MARVDIRLFVLGWLKDHRGGDLRTHGYAIRSLEVEEGGRVS